MELKIDLIITILLWIAKFVVSQLLSGLIGGIINARNPTPHERIQRIKFLVYMAGFIVAVVVFAGEWPYVLLLGAISGIVGGLFEKLFYRPTEMELYQ